MLYKPVFTLQELQSNLSDTVLAAFDFETSPNDQYRNEGRAALDAHKSRIVGISFSKSENNGIYTTHTQNRTKCH